MWIGFLNLGTYFILIEYDFGPSSFCFTNSLNDPIFFRCIILTFDDGTLRLLSLVKAAYDVPVTGKPFTGTNQKGLHSYSCSSSAIWSVQVSRQTGISVSHDLLAWVVFHLLKRIYVTIGS